MNEKSILNNSLKSINTIKNPDNFPRNQIYGNLLETQDFDNDSISVILTVCYQKMDGSFDMNKAFDIPLNLTTPLCFHPDISQILKHEQKVREQTINEKAVLVHSLSFKNCVGQI